VTPDYYAVLGVASDANQELIRSAYLALAKRYHPDSATGASPKNDEKFRSVSEAYEKLRDPNRRKQYDMRQARQEQERKEARARAGYSQPYKPSASAGGSSQTKSQSGKIRPVEGNAARPQTRSPNSVHNSLVFSGGAFAVAALILGLIALASKNPASIELRTDAAGERDSTITAPVDHSSARPCGQLSHPEYGGGDGDDSEVVGCGFLEARGDASELLEPAEAAFDEMSLGIEVSIERMLGRSRGVVGDDGERTFAGDRQPEVVGVIGGIGDDDIGGHAVDERSGLRSITGLAGGEDEAHRAAQAANGEMDLGGQAAARASDGLIASPPFAPQECWWARTMVESTIKYSKSGSSDSASKMRRQTPFSLHRLKRRKTLFHSPNASGRSRHGEPVRTIHKTPSTNIRLSRPVEPH
jgi:curved DNA-binding protein CbpA